LIHNGIEELKDYFSTMAEAQKANIDILEIKIAGNLASLLWLF